MSYIGANSQGTIGVHTTNIIDSSKIRVAGHTIAEHDIVNDKVDIKNATLASSVTPNNNYSYYTMAKTNGTASSASINFSSVTTVLEDSDFYTSSFSSNTLTITFQKSGYYKLSNSFYVYGSNNIPTYIYAAAIGGTATRYGLGPNNQLGDSSGLSQPIWSTHSGMQLGCLIQADVSETVSILPSFTLTSNAVTNYLGANIELIKVR